MAVPTITDGVSCETKSKVDGEPEAGAGLLSNSVMPIAVVGMACRFPGGSSTPEKFWDMLAKKKDGWSPVPAERFTHASFQHPGSSVAGTYNSQGAHFLKEDVSLFDAPAFNISPLEAKAMDPQMRLLLEVAYESLENGGMTLDEIAGSKTAVCIGVFSDDYSNMMLSDPESLPAHHVTGTGKAIFANRISYFFDLKGPSFSLDTGCSASFVALHQACQSIRSGESSQAIVGGTNLILSPKTMMSLGGLGFLSDHGKCYSFDSRGSGYGRGEGVASVFLKPLKDAIAQRDPIRAIIRNTLLNQDGRTPGLTMPSRQAQADLIRSAYEQAGLDPLDTQYVEAHGTGTKAGDPIEVEAIADAMSRSRSPSRPLLIGSVKANIGHLESTSGLAGLVKAILCLEKGLIPPSINFQTENKDLHLKKRRLRVATEIEPWPSGSLRRASLNSFGYGGANAHIILEAHIPIKRIDQPALNGAVTVNGNIDKNVLDLFTSLRPSEGRRKIFLLSHRSKSGTLQVAKQLRRYVSCFNVFADHSMDSLAHSLNSRRTTYTWRAVVSAATSQDLISALAAPSLEPRRSLQDQRISFIFTGQGAQWYGMGRELIGRYVVFRSTLLASDKHFRSLGSPWSLMDELMKPSEASLVNSAAIGQPLCTAVQCALVELLRSWNVKPTSVMGHSSGEIAAAYACGSILLESALTVSYFRGLTAGTWLEGNEKLHGAMLAASVSEADAEALIRRIRPGRGKAVVACVNSPGSVTFSGDRPAILSLQSMLEAREIFARRLRTGTAYHSHHMEIVADSYLETLIDLPEPTAERNVKFFSSVTGKVMHGIDLNAAYWVKNMVSQVKFSHCLQKLHESSIVGTSTMHTLLELGPHGALAGFVKQTLGITGGEPFRHISTLSRGKDAIATMLDAASQLVISGYPADIQAVNRPNDHSPNVLVDLPPYPWDHSTSHWHESRLSIEYRKRFAPRHPLLGAPASDFNSIEPRWRNIIRISEIPWILGHVVQSNIVYPAAGYVVMAVEAMCHNSQLRAQGKSISSYRLRNVSIRQPLIIPDTSEGIETQLSLRPYNQSAYMSSEVWNEFRIFSYAPGDGWTEHCRGLISCFYKQDLSAVEGERELNLQSARYAQDIELARTKCRNITDPIRLYRTLGDLGFRFQGPFQSIEDAAVGAQQSLGHIKIPDTASEMPGSFQHPHVVHPSTLDACMQMTTPILLITGVLRIPMVPTFIKKINIAADIPRAAGERLLVHASTQVQGKRSFKASITAGTDNASPRPIPVVEIRGLVCTAIPGGTSTGLSETGDRCHKMRWEVSPELDSDGDSALTDTPEVGDTMQVTLITPERPTPLSQLLISRLSSALGDRLVKWTSSFEDIADAGLEGKVCVCLAEVEGSILKTCTAAHWSAVRQMLCSPSKVLWLTMGATSDLSSADAGLITGLARSARSDNPMLSLVTYDLDADAISSIETVNLVLSAIKQSFKHTGRTRDMEFAQKSGRILVPRVIEDEVMQLHLAEPKVRTQTFFQRDQFLCLDVAVPGLLDSLRFVEDTTATVTLAPDELRMQPRAYGVNFRDVMIALGQLETTSLMSSEFSGIVTEVGSAIMDRFQVGDRICAWKGMPYAASVTVHKDAVQQIPQDMTFETAASIPIVYATAYYALVHLARLRKGESVLIHSAAGGVGQAAIMLAKHLEAIIIVTVSSKEKKELLIQRYQIPEERIFSSRQLGFADGVKRLTHGRGVDVILNSLAGEAFHETFECLASLGRFIEIGKQDILANSRLNMATFNKSVTFASVDLTVVFKQAPTLAQRMITEIFALLAAGSLQPVQPLNVFPLSEIEVAFRLMQAGKHTGKVVLQASLDTVVKALPRSSASASFGEHASYILIGGLGGLGRAICRWLVSRGCKNIIVLSRSGLESKHSASLTDELESKGVKLAIHACDVGDREQVDNTLSLCSQQMPPIKGVIQSAMVIRDKIINQMTWEDYRAALRPKVQGTLNMHYALLDTPLEFFLMLSSCVGVIGNEGQANYASACTFQDAFARHRTGLGMPTRSIDVGMIEDAGYVSEHEDVHKFLTAQGFRPVQMDELLAVIDYAISQPVRDVDDSQIIIGLTNPHRTAAQQMTHLRDAKFAHIRSAAASAGSDSSTKPSSLHARLQDAASVAELHNIVREVIIAQVGKVLVVPAEDINAAQSISHYGGDSLSAVELRSWFARSLDATIGVMEILSGKSIDALTREVLVRSQLVQGLPIARDAANHGNHASS